jgi:hypothetical protein
MACHRWTAKDIEMLGGLSGDLPWPMVVDAFNRWATQHNRPQRTDSALIKMCFRHGFPRRAVGAWITTDMIKAVAGISHKRVARWIRGGRLQGRKFHEDGIHYIRRVDLRRFARKHPHEFGGVSLASLVMLFDNEQLAQQIHEMELPRPKLVHAKPVVCVETGQRYESIHDAARNCYVTRQRLRIVLNHPGRTANGLHWEVAG